MVKNPPLPDVSPQIADLLRALGHEEPFHHTVAGSAGSGRVYWRVGTPPGSHVLLVSHAGDADYDRFLSISRHLRAQGLRVPTVHGSDDGARQVVLEDLGSELLLGRVHAAGFPGDGDLAALEADYRRVLEAMAEWQERGTAGMGSCPALSDRVFDREALRWETDYFARRFAHEVRGADEAVLSDPGLLAEFEGLAGRVEGHARVLMHRDFQSQNLMWRGGLPWFIDYQGARGGSRWYDLASLLWDPYAGVPEGTRERLFQEFLAMRPDPRGVEVARFELREAALQRVMQALGAYGFLTLHKGLPWFSRHMEPALANLRGLLADREDLPALRRLVDRL